MGGAAALKAVMDSLEAACACPTVRVDGGDQLQGTLESNLLHGAPVVAAFNYIGLDAAAIGNHELDWGVDTLLVRQRESRYEWLAANVFRRDSGERPEWATPFAVVERDGVKVGIVGYATVSTPYTLRPEVTAPYEFRSGYAAIRDALEGVRRVGADFVVVVAHAGGDCNGGQCAGEVVDLAEELPVGSVHMIAGGHIHAPGAGLVDSVPIVRAGSHGRAVAVVDLYRHADGTHGFSLSTAPVIADVGSGDAGDEDAGGADAAMADLLAPYLAVADSIGRVPVTTLNEPLSASATGDRRLGQLIADAVRAVAAADFGMHNPGGVRADLPRGLVSYRDLHRVLPFGNAVVRLTLTGRQLQELVSRTGPRYYLSNLIVEWDPAAASEAGGARLRFVDGAPVEADRSYTLATNDFLADGGDGLAVLTSLPRVVIGVTVLDAVAGHLSAWPDDW